MRFFSILFISLGILVIIFPSLLRILVGGLFILLGTFLFSVANILGSKAGPNEKEFIKFGKYKIYKK